MSAVNCRVFVKRTSDGATYLTSDADHATAFWNSAELGGVDFTLTAWSDMQASASLRVHNLNFSTHITLTASELETLAGALLQCAADLKAQAHTPLKEAA